jgi:hypothetical protein
LHVEVELAVNFGPRFLSFRLIEGGATHQRGIDNCSFAEQQTLRLSVDISEDWT